MNKGREQTRGEQMKLQDQAIQKTLERVKHKILILSGKGGVGKSTVAVNLAVALAKAGRKVGLLDVDLHGPSVPRLLGLGKYKVGFVDGQILPIQYAENLKVISIENLLEMHDSAVIWRGPLKIGAIRQFLADVSWGELDYLIIDSPPGTGDEPLTIAQSIPGAQAIIVTTPQEISLADVRKSINFCRTVELPVFGLIENMSGYVCPQCGHSSDIFGSGGGERTARETGLSFLGRIPIDPSTVLSGDEGRPNLSEGSDTPASIAFRRVVDAVLSAHEGKEPKPQLELVKGEAEEGKGQPVDPGEVKIAVPVSNGLLANHFGHCEEFMLFDVKDSKIAGRQVLTAPPHEPGALPAWLRERGADVIISGGMGSRARGFFDDFGIKVVTGAPAGTPEQIVEAYLAGALETGQNICDH